MSKNGSVECNRPVNSSEDIEGEGPESRTLTQELDSEQIKVFIASLRLQLDELTRLV